MQRELGTIKRLFKQNEITTQLDNCEAELKAALKIFTVSGLFCTTAKLTTAFGRWNLELESHPLLPSGWTGSSERRATDEYPP
jgi:hypothetical protein